MGWAKIKASNYLKQSFYKESHQKCIELIKNVYFCQASSIPFKLHVHKKTISNHPEKHFYSPLTTVAEHNTTRWQEIKFSKIKLYHKFKFKAFSRKQAHKFSCATSKKVKAVTKIKWNHFLINFFSLSIFWVFFLSCCFLKHFFPPASSFFMCGWAKKSESSSLLPCFYAQ